MSEPNQDLSYTNHLESMEGLGNKVVGKESGVSSHNRMYSDIFRLPIRWSFLLLGPSGIDKKGPGSRGMNEVMDEFTNFPEQRGCPFVLINQLKFKSLLFNLRDTVFLRDSLKLTVSLIGWENHSSPEVSPALKVIIFLRGWLSPVCRDWWQR